MKSMLGEKNRIPFYVNWREENNRKKYVIGKDTCTLKWLRYTQFEKEVGPCDVAEETTTMEKRAKKYETKRTINK